VSLASLSLLAACARPPLTDDDLIKAFQRNRRVFDAIASQSNASNPDCSEKDPTICVPKTARSLESEFKRKTGLPVKAIYFKIDLSRSLWIPLESYGPLSMSSSSRGYVFCKCNLLPITQDTIEALGQGTNGEWYRPLDGGWMLFAVR
jgi:hypothetical protein